MIASMGERADFDELVDAWWKTARAMDAMPGDCSDKRRDWHAWNFEKVLTSNGWTTAEWNEAVEARKASEPREAKRGSRT